MRESCCRPCVTAGMNAPKANASGNTFLKDSFQRLISPKEVRTGTQAGEEAGADAEAMEGCFLLACFLCLAQLAFL